MHVNIHHTHVTQLYAYYSENASALMHIFSLLSLGTLMSTLETGLPHLTDRL